MIGIARPVKSEFSSRAACCLRCRSCRRGRTRWHSKEWYEERAGDPPGTRQVYKHGKLWPPFARPQGKHLTFWHKYYNVHYWPTRTTARTANTSTAFPAAIEQWLGIRHHAARLPFRPGNQPPEFGRRKPLDVESDAGPGAVCRTTFVSPGGSEQVGQFRMAAVQESAREICGDTVPPIILKNDMFLGRPAIEIDTLRRLELQSIPQPRLFIISAGGTSSASGPSSSQAGGASGQPQTGQRAIRVGRQSRQVSDRSLKL